MKINYGNIKVEIKNIVQTKGKYQKVMLLFDDFVSNLEIKEIYSEIKDFCIYNQCHINQVDKNELNNGYRVVVYLCCADNFLKAGISNADFINVFCPKDKGMLPFFLTDECCCNSAENYLLLEKTQVDVGLISSICFNQFINYFENLMNGESKAIDFIFASQEIFQHNIINQMEKIDKNLKFFDIELMKNCSLPYEKLALVDLILINAFFVMITSIKNQKLMIVDVYKAAKENGELIDKFYSLVNNNAFTSIVILNYNCLYNFCEKTKQKILNCVNVFNFNNNDVEEVVKEIKEYAKQDKGLLSYLYLYNIFGV